MAGPNPLLYSSTLRISDLTGGIVHSSTRSGLLDGFPMQQVRAERGTSKNHCCYIRQHGLISRRIIEVHHLQALDKACTEYCRRDYLTYLFWSQSSDEN